jgi:hypothetical protein
MGRRYSGGKEGESLAIFHQISGMATVQDIPAVFG